MSVKVNNTEYASSAVTSAIKQGNKNLTSGSSGELSESNMNDIISYAKDKGIQIIPLFNAPGHMYTVVSAMNTLDVGGKYLPTSTPSDDRTRNWAVDPTDSTAVAFAEALLQKYVTYFAEKGSTMFNIGADESGLSAANYASYADMVNGMNAIVKKAGMTTLAYNDGIYNTAFAASQTDVKFDNDIIICYWTSGANSASVADFLNKGFKILNNSDNWYYVLGDYLYTAWGSKNGQWGYNDALNGIKSTPVTQMKDYTGTEKPIGSVLCVWSDAPNQTYESSKVYALIKAMADANPEYFTDEVKLPAADTSADVSVEVVGKKGETASVKAETITSAYTFDVENVVSYNVTPTIDGKAYSGSGTVTLPVPSGWEQNPSRVRAYIIDNGAVKMIRGTYSDGKYTFDVPHFSEMGLLQLAENAAVEPITVAEGRTVKKTVDGNQTITDASNLDKNIATVKTEPKSAGKTIKEVTSIEPGGSYLIYNQRYKGVLTNSTVKTEWDSCLELEKAEASADNANVWTITANGSNYQIADTKGKYLQISDSAASVSTTEANLTLKYNQASEYWHISQDSYYLNNLGESNNAGGWKDSRAPTDAGSKWTIYQIVEETSDSTTISFTGVKAGGPTYVTVGDTTYEITVTEKQTVEIPISIIDYRADGLLFDFQVGGETYDYGLVHNYDNDGDESSVNGGTLSGTSYGTRIAGTTLENTGYVAGDNFSGNYYLWGNKWSRSGMVESKLGSNGMPVYTNATVARVAQELAAGNYNSAEMAGVANSNDVIYNKFILSGKVVGSDDTEMSAAFSDRKSWDNINNAYDLAWYLLNTLYQADTNMTTVTDADGVSHTVPIYGMAVNAYDSIILTENNGVYTFDAANGKSHYDTASRSIYEGDSVESLQFYPIDGLGYDAILGDTTDKTDNSGKDTVVRPEHPNGSYTLRGEAQFVYQDDLYFEFSGDDDVYMYVNGTLALDLGGAHGICTKRVNLKDVAEKCNLTPGEVATFTFFYMERNSDASNFKIETNMELVKPGISVAKKAYDSGYANEIPNGAAVETGKSAYYDLIVTNQSNVAMNQISFADTDSREGTANFGYGVANASVSTGTVNNNGTVSLKESGSYVIYVTDANETEVSGTRQTLTSLSALSEAVAAVTLQPNQSLHVRFLQAEFKVGNAKILNYENTVNVTATVGNQSLKARATHELYSYNAGDTSRTYVVDFGLPLKIEGIFDKDVKNNVGEVSLSSTNVLKYGEITTFTPNEYDTSLVYTRTADKTINDAETIVLDVTYLMGSNKVTLQKTLTIIPATTVYYEDSLATFTNADSTKNVAQVDNAGKGIWTKVTDGTTQTNVNQALEELGGTTNTKYVYGYDPAYADSSKFSMGSATKVTVDASTSKTYGQWPTATFTFKGTGFDVISLTNSDSGTVVYTVTNKSTGASESHIINNYYGYRYDETTGKWVVANNDRTAPYQVPVIKVSGLAYDTYEVTISVIYGALFDNTGDQQYSFWLDAIRVYDPAGATLDTEYAKDHENAPNYVRIKQVILDSKALETEGATGAVFIDGKGANGVTADDYKNQGPNHEAYLADKQAIAFQLIANAKPTSVQIGAKLASGDSASLKIGGAACAKANDGTLTLNTATDMYYELTDMGWTQSDGVYKSSVITLTNAGSGIISLTNLKFIGAEYTSSLPEVKSATSETNLVTLAVSSEMIDEALTTVDGALNPAPETFEPSHFEADWNRSVRAGQKATLTVKTSEDVDAITVDGQTITTYRTRTERTGWGWWSPRVTYRVFTYTTTAQATADYEVCALNSSGVASEPITATLTVKPAINWWHKWF